MKLVSNAEVSASIDLLSAWIESQMAYKGLPGLSMGIVYDQELIWAHGFGFANVQDKIPSTPQTIYRIASITKTFTATAILQLRDAGKLQLDDPVTRHLPWFKVQNPFPDTPVITIQHLITHTSGLPREAGCAYWNSNEFPEMEEVKRLLPRQKLAVPPESRWKYSNLAVSLAGEIVAAVSGQPYPDYVQEHILDPLGMQSTYVSTIDPGHPLLATPYDRRMPDLSRALAPFTDVRGLTPAGNMATTVEDLARFAMLQFRSGLAGGEQILSGNTLREMQRIHWLQPDWQAGWGWGFRIERLSGKTIVGHGGAVRGYRTRLAFCPEDKVAVIMLINADDGDPQIYSDRVFEWVSPAITKAVKPAEKLKPDPEWQRYLGKYRNSWGDSQVLLHRGDLVVIEPNAEDPLDGFGRLMPLGEHTFRLETDSGFSSPGEQVRFELDGNGQAHTMIVGEEQSWRIENW